MVGLAVLACAIELLWFRQLREISNSSNKPIEFYGICLDQDDNPVPDVTVEFQIRWNQKIWPLGIRDVFKNPIVATSAGGRFSLVGEKGAILRVGSMRKDGYEPSQKSLNRSFWYWRDPRDVFHPDSDHPVIYRLWKKRGAERLVDKGLGHRIPYDGTPIVFDLVEGQVVASRGDWRVSLVRNPIQIKWGQNNYEWTATIEALNGGLMESHAEQMYFAPTSGYQQKLIIHMKADDPQWTDTMDLQVYFKLRDNLFGRAEVTFMVGSDRPQGTPFSIKSYINPTGSQNLEYDPLQTIAGWKPTALTPPGRKQN